MILSLGSRGDFDLALYLRGVHRDQLKKRDQLLFHPPRRGKKEWREQLSYHRGRLEQLESLAEILNIDLWEGVK